MQKIRHFKGCPYLNNTAPCNCGALIAMREVQNNPPSQRRKLNINKRFGITKYKGKWKVVLKGRYYGVFEKWHQAFSFMAHKLRK